jgi:hypothetical protein
MESDNISLIPYQHHSGMKENFHHRKRKETTMNVKHLAHLALTSLVTVVGIASPATANSADCPSGKFCIWTNDNYEGRIAYFSRGSANLANPIGGYVFNNKVTSIWNRTGSAWCLYDGANYRTGLLRQSAGGYRSNLAVEGINNKTSSLKSC